MPQTDEPEPSPAETGATWVRLAELLGGGLLSATSAIHLDLYLTGYRLIPTIGVLFLLQVAVGLFLGLAVLGSAVLAFAAVPRFSWRGIPADGVAMGAGALFALATLGGYLLSLAVGLFGFREIRTTAGIVASALEVAAFLALGWGAAGTAWTRARRFGLAPLAAVAAILLVVAEMSATPVASSGPTTSTPSSGGSEVIVIIKNFVFHPDDPVARPGERILVRNDDSVAHTFSTEPGAPAAKAFSTGAIPPGGSRVVAAPEASGRYGFLCLIHQFMTGTLTVTASGSSSRSSPPAGG